MSVDLSITSITNDLTVRNEFLDIRSLSQNVFDEAEGATFRVVDIDPGKTSMSLATFRYYGNLDKLAAHIGLNPSVNAANFDTGIKVLAG